VEKLEDYGTNYLLFAPFLDFYALYNNVMTNSGLMWMIAYGLEGAAGVFGLCVWFLAKNKSPSLSSFASIHVVIELAVFLFTIYAEKGSKNTKNSGTVMSFFNAGLSAILSISTIT